MSHKPTPYPDDTTDSANSPEQVAAAMLETRTPDAGIALLHRIAFLGAGGDWRRAQWTRQIDRVGYTLLMVEAAEDIVGQERGA